MWHERKWGEGEKEQEMRMRGGKPQKHGLEERRGEDWGRGEGVRSNKKGEIKEKA